MRKLVCVIFILVCLLLMYVTSDSSALNQSSIKQAEAEAEAIEYIDSSYQVEYLSDGRQIKAKEFQIVYDPHTKIVFYKSGDRYLTYPSPKGGYYRYINGKLTEFVNW